MATSYYYTSSDWRTNTDTPYIPYGEAAYKNVYNQDWLSNHSYLFYNGGNANATSKKEENNKVIKSPYVYSYLDSNNEAYEPSFLSSYTVKSPERNILNMNGGNKNDIIMNELKHRYMIDGEPLLFKTKDIVGPNPCFQPYRYSNDSIIDPYFLPKVDKDLPPVNYYSEGGGKKKSNKKYKSKSKLRSTKKKALRYKKTKKRRNTQTK